MNELDAGQGDNEAGDAGDPTEMGSEVINDPDASAAGSSEDTGETGGEAGTEGDKGANGADKDPVVFDERQQGVFDNAMGGKTKQLRDQQRQNQQLQEENAALHAKLPKSERPVIPDKPDPLDADFAEKTTARETALQAAATFDANEKTASEQALVDQQTQQQQTQQQIDNAVNDYKDRGTKLGIKAEDLAQAEQTLLNAGINPMVQAFLIDQPTGPRITAYLAKHPGEMNDILALNPMAAAAKIGSEISAKAAEFFKIGDQPPDPSENLSGKGSKEGERGPKGATYE